VYRQTGKRTMDPSDARGIGKYINLALLLPIATFIGYAMGYGLDMLFHTMWIRYVFLLLGSIAGFIELIRELSKGT
jgi:F0F1-type ATP synthase assembly protein I